MLKGALLPSARRAGQLADGRVRQHRRRPSDGPGGGPAEDEFPHAIMLDPEQLMPYLRVNKLGERFTPE